MSDEDDVVNTLRAFQTLTGTVNTQKLLSTVQCVKDGDTFRGKLRVQSGRRDPLRETRTAIVGITGYGEPAEVIRTEAYANHVLFTVPVEGGGNMLAMYNGSGALIWSMPDTRPDATITCMRVLKDGSAVYATNKTANYVNARGHTDHVYSTFADLPDIVGIDCVGNMWAVSATLDVCVWSVDSDRRILHHETGDLLLEHGAKFRGIVVTTSTTAHVVVENADRVITMVSLLLSEPAAANGRRTLSVQCTHVLTTDPDYITTNHGIGVLASDRDDSAYTITFFMARADGTLQYYKIPRHRPTIRRCDDSRRVADGALRLLHATTMNAGRPIVVMSVDGYTGAWAPPFYLDAENRLHEDIVPQTIMQAEIDRESERMVACKFVDEGASVVSFKAPNHLMFGEEALVRATRLAMREVVHLTGRQEANRGLLLHFRDLVADGEANRKRLEAELEAANKELKSSTKRHDADVSMLKTIHTEEITTLQMSVEGLERKLKASAKRERKAATTIEKQKTHLEKLSTELAAKTRHGATEIAAKDERILELEKRIAEPPKAKLTLVRNVERTNVDPRPNERVAELTHELEKVNHDAVEAAALLSDEIKKLQETVAAKDRELAEKPPPTAAPADERVAVLEAELAKEKTLRDIAERMLSKEAAAKRTAIDEMSAARKHAMDTASQVASFRTVLESGTPIDVEVRRLRGVVAALEASNTKLQMDVNVLASKRLPGGTKLDDIPALAHMEGIIVQCNELQVECARLRAESTAAAAAAAPTTTDE